MAQPQTTDDELVKVANAADEAEAEFVQGLLRAEGVPSLLRRAPGADVPEFLAAGPREVLVPAGRADDARDVLLLVPGVPHAPAHASAAPPASRRVLAAGLILVALVAAAVCVAFDVVPV